MSDSLTYRKTKATRTDADRYRALRATAEDPVAFDAAADALLAAAASSQPTPKTKHPLYKRWQGMLARVKDRRPHVWKDYGARGISVCPRWSSSFEAFVADMGMPPSPEHTLDRIDSNGNYEPSNCRWASVTQQNRNRRSPRFARVGVPGVTECNGRYRVTVRAADGRQVHVGMADTVDEATAMRKSAERLHWG